MDRLLSVAPPSATSAALALALAGPACAGPTHETETPYPESVSGGCSLSVTENTYYGRNYWGTISVKNQGPHDAAGLAVQFDVPSGAHCTNDTVPVGATLGPLSGSGPSATTRANHCVFAWPSTSLPTGASITFHYSADSTTFSAGAKVLASASSCSGSSGGDGGRDGAGDPADAEVGDGALATDAPDASACAPAPGASDVPPPPSTRMIVDSFDGPVTRNEITSFKAYIQTITPATWVAPAGIGNSWAQGHSGEDVKAMGVMYEISRDPYILDRMLVFCDTVLSQRNDLAPAPEGQYTLWTGRIDPAWPNDVAATPIGTGGEQGDPVGHLASCARLILTTPSLWNEKVKGGDPHGYGATYLERAKRYVREADFAIDNHILKSLLDVSNQDRQTFSAASPYMGGSAVPWNQQMMFDYGFQNLAASHAILADDPARAARYDALVQSSMDWFFHSGATTSTDPKGKPAYDWGYNPTISGGEDSNHGSLDVAGFSRAYALGRYGLTEAMMTPFANMFADLMTKGPGQYAGRVDGTDGTGHGAPTTYVRSGYLLLSAFRPDAYAAMMTGAGLKAGGTTSAIDAFSRFEWVKYRRCLQHR